MLFRSTRRGVALVEEQDAGGARGSGVVALDLERAGAALDERDVAGRESCEVVGLTPAGGRVADPQLDVDRCDRGRHVAFLRVRCRAEVRALLVGDRVGRHLLHLRGAKLLERVVVELLGAHLVAGGLEPVSDVLRRGGVPCGPRGARAAVVVGDLLEHLLVLHDTVKRHALEHLAQRVVGAVAGRVRQGAGRGGHGKSGCYQTRGGHENCCLLGQSHKNSSGNCASSLTPFPQSRGVRALNGRVASRVGDWPGWHVPLGSAPHARVR